MATQTIADWNQIIATLKVFNTLQQSSNGTFDNTASRGLKPADFESDPHSLEIMEPSAGVTN
jgi:hypothetical protein